jgi:hypothetical protein
LGGGGGLGHGEIKQLRPLVFAVILILEKAEQERDFFVRRRGLAAVQIPQQRLAGRAGFRLASARQSDQSGDQLRSMPGFSGTAGSIGASTCRRSLPLKSRCQVKNGHMSTRRFYDPVCGVFFSTVFS